LAGSASGNFKEASLHDYRPAEAVAFLAHFADVNDVPTSAFTFSATGAQV
jgi:hypothetical protein